MTVTELVELSRTRSKVFLDQEYAFVLYRGEMQRYGIKIGEELSGENYQKIMTEVLPKRAKLRAMNLLKSREYTTKQLRDKLEQGGYPSRVVDQALEYVASFHYTDDWRYAVNFLRCKADSRSRKRLDQDLQRRGISMDVIEAAWEEWEEQGGKQDEEEMIRELLAKRKYAADTADYKEQQKQFAFLMRKGFSSESIRRAMKIDL